MRKAFLIIGLVCLAALSACAQTAVSVAPVARQQFFTASGVPLAGGLIYTYASGTSTPQATFTDFSGTTQNTNPIVLDAGGMAQIWLAGGETYRFVAKDQFGVQQWLVDGVVGSPNLLSPGPIGTTTPNVVETTELLTASSTPALSGLIRLASGDQICWRNNANSADVCLRKDTSDTFQLPSTNFTTTDNPIQATNTNNSTGTSDPGKRGAIFNCHMVTSNGHCYGVLAIASEEAADSGNELAGVEANIRPEGALSSYSGIYGFIAALNPQQGQTGTPFGAAYEIEANDISGVQWDWGLRNFDGSTSTLTLAQASCLTGTCGSAAYLAQGMTGGVDGPPASLSASAAGDWQISPAPARSTFIISPNIPATCGSGTCNSYALTLNALNAGTPVSGTLDFLSNGTLALGMDLQSSTANPASVGTLRLANTDVVAWRNTANSNNLQLQPDSSDYLEFNSNRVYTNGGTTTSAGTCPTTATAFATCTVTVPLNRTEPDTAYAASCSVAAVAAGDPWVKSIAKGTTSITVLISNLSSTGATASTPGETDCTVTR